MATYRTLGEAVDAGEPVTVLFDLLQQLAFHREWIPLGFRRIELPRGFIVTVNGTRQEREDELGVPIAPFEATVIRNEWPLGTIAMFGGVLMAGVEPELIEALKEALQRSVQETPEAPQ